jgi:hypothetical protein
MIYPSTPACMDMISVFGVGVLVGTTLIIIIPEGVKAMLEESDTSGCFSFPKLDYIGPPNWRLLP